MPISMKYHTLSKYKDGKTMKRIMMTYITEEEEKTIDNKEDIVIERGDKTFILKGEHIYVYGHIDFNDKQDCDYINKINLTSNILKPIPIHANYDYVTHCCYSSTKGVKWTEASDSLDVVKYAYGCLAKPKRVVIFKHVEKI